MSGGMYGWWWWVGGGVGTYIENKDFSLTKKRHTGAVRFRKFVLKKSFKTFEVIYLQLSVLKGTILRTAMPKSPQSKDKTLDAADDARFSAMHSGATFGSSRNETHKVKLDSRFESVLTDERFRNAPGQIDRYGRKAKSSGKKAASKELEQFYKIDKPDDKTLSIDQKPKFSAAAGTKKSSGKTVEDRMEYINRLSRGEISDTSSGSSSDSFDEEEGDSESSSDDETSNKRDHETKKRSVLDIPVEDDEDEDVPTGESSRRLAIMHCDWDNIKCEDLIVVLQSFCPEGGSVRNVTVYPSDFGIERMAKEREFGPQGIWSKTVSIPGDDDSGSNASFQDLYDDIEGDAQSGIGSDEDDAEKSKRRLSKGADFKRKGNVVGLVSTCELFDICIQFISGVIFGTMKNKTILEFLL